MACSSSCSILLAADWVMFSAAAAAQRAAFLDGQQQHDLPHAQARQQGGGIQGSFHD